MESNVSKFIEPGKSLALGEGKVLTIPKEPTKAMSDIAAGVVGGVNHEVILSEMVEVGVVEELSLRPDGKPYSKRHYKPTAEYEHYFIKEPRGWKIPISNLEPFYAEIREDVITAIALASNNADIDHRTLKVGELMKEASAVYFRAEGRLPDVKWMAKKEKEIRRGLSYE